MTWGTIALNGVECPAALMESFDDFYAREIDNVHRALSLTLGDPHRAQEAADEGMARAYAYWRRVSRLDNPGGWVYRVGLNWATSQWRKRRHEAPYESAASLHGQAPDEDARGYEAAEALRRLPLPQRAVVVCRVVLQLSTAETAAALGLSEGTVKSRLARGLDALRAQLGEETP